MAQRYPPRKLPLDELIRKLVSEHATMKDGMRRAKEAAAGGDFEAVARALKEIDPIFRQHIADEEAQLLGLLISSLGVKGAEEEILVFRQHRPIYGLMVKIGELAGTSSAELESKQAELAALFDEHTNAEESVVFPRVASLRPGVRSSGL